MKKDQNWWSKVLIKGFLLLMVVMTAAGIGINFYMQQTVKARIIAPEAARGLNADCILILGAGVWGNDRPGFVLEDRLRRGIELYAAGVSDRMLMSGDHGRTDYDEVNVMKQYAVERGVPSKKVFMDHAGFSTYESLYRAREVFKARKIVIVTQQYHMYRALYIAERLGLEAYGVSSDFRVLGGQDYRESREVLARMKDFVYAAVQPKPTYLGDEIPLTGDGDQTND